jgi:AcrR family transcriptional regulator
MGSTSVPLTPTQPIAAVGPIGLSYKWRMPPVQYTEAPSAYQGGSTMVEEAQPDPTRPLRADARRNRARLIDVAKAMFSECGADTGLEAIAKAAGVGIGTLYRHFPTRDTLIEAVYRTETQKLSQAAPRLAETLPPVEALRARLRLFVDHIATKQVMSPVLASMVGGTSELYAESGAQVKAAIGLLVDRAVATGAIRLDIEPLDLLRALAGVAGISSVPGWEKSAKRLVDILIAGVRVPPEA